MTFDPKGTAPGLASGSAPEQKVHHMKCRRDGCSSARAIEISLGQQGDAAGAAHNRVYQCVECKHTWPMSVGGSVNF